MRIVSEAKTRIGDVLRQAKDRRIYEYDFGDGWVRDIVLEEVLLPRDGAHYPVIENGKRDCPPEDVGGIH